MGRGLQVSARALVAIGLLSGCTAASESLVEVPTSAPETDDPAPAPRETPRFTSIETGLERRACGLDQRGQLWCWSLESLGAPQPELLARRVTEAPQARGLELRDERVCVLGKSGLRWCRGDDDTTCIGDACAPFEHPERHGAGPECELLGDGGLECSNLRYYDRVEPYTPPARVPTRGVWRELVEGSHHACALDFDGGAYCWGRRRWPSVTDGLTRDEHRDARLVAAGEAHTCVVTGDRQVDCWGRNHSGVLGVAEPSAREGSLELPARALELAAAGDTTCARLEDLSVWCWGLTEPLECTYRPSPGGLTGCGGRSTPAPKRVSARATELVPVIDGVCHATARRRDRVPGLTRWKELTPESSRPGLMHLGPPARLCDDVTTTTLDARGSARVHALFVQWFPWERYYVGLHCALGADRARLTCKFDPARTDEGPRTLELPPNAARVVAGERQLCAVGAAELRCWGGELEDSHASDNEPLPLPPTRALELHGRLIDLAVGGAHVCVIDERGLTCWGSNKHGQVKPHPEPLELEPIPVRMTRAP